MAINLKFYTQKICKICYTTTLAVVGILYSYILKFTINSQRHHGVEKRKEATMPFSFKVDRFKHLKEKEETLLQQWKRKGEEESEVDNGKWNLNNLYLINLKGESFIAFRFRKSI